MKFFKKLLSLFKREKQDFGTLLNKWAEENDWRPTYDKAYRFNFEATAITPFKIDDFEEKNEKPNSSV